MAHALWSFSCSRTRPTPPTGFGLTLALPSPNGLGYLNNILTTDAHVLQDDGGYKQTLPWSVPNTSNEPAYTVKGLAEAQP
ncbi:hypothetical protein PGTUg99_017302 [Puccinia graminis f. sp. tritici]|uniref:Uncharacterized protein n=1 Tax=Puccinia graminis f. sp. tritici TaxID=56615 RepID=A0A5B0SKY6_PUCGR|nr:hypothetical protein PGTUg99_017302 [Puccinia graminis f. sp. tritici]